MYRKRDNINPSSNVYNVKIVKNGQILKEYTLDELKKFKMVKFEVNGKEQEGPALEDLLKEFSYQKVIIKGVNGKIELIKEQVKDVILDFTNHGTVKMASKTAAGATGLRKSELWSL